MSALFFVRNFRFDSGEWRFKAFFSKVSYSDVITDIATRYFRINCENFTVKKWNDVVSEIAGRNGWNHYTTLKAVKITARKDHFLLMIYFREIANRPHYYVDFVRKFRGCRFLIFERHQRFIQYRKEGNSRREQEEKKRREMFYRKYNKLLAHRREINRTIKLLKEFQNDNKKHNIIHP